ncbi:putative Cytochrome P450-containing protein [Homarus americanus]|uniref:Putative Cytochrome P450-containing protein n=1 Tax=Homarus americanus TaxID=6706 RepID=A0A8J5JRB1_HOMAM|nr:putative Cytochrome P450-containing protein [Homarus americanus]
MAAVGVVSLGTRLGCLHPDAHDHQGHHDLSSTRASRVITANQNILELLGESMFLPPFYKYFPSRMYRRLSHAQDTIAGIVQEELMLRQEERAQDPEAFSFHHPFLDSLFSNSQLPTMDVFLLLVEIFQGGIDATFVTSPPVVACHDPQVFPQPDVFWPERWLSTYSRTTSSTHTTPTQDPPPAHHNTPTQNPPPSHHNTSTQDPPPVHHNTPTQDPPPAHHNTPTQDPPPAQESQEDASGKRIHPYTIVAFGHGARMCPGRRLAELEIKFECVTYLNTFPPSDSVSSNTYAGGCPQSFQGCPQSFQGCPQSFQGCPHSFQGCPHSFQGCPQFFQGCPQSFQGCPQSFQGCPQSFQGCPQSFQGCPQSFQQYTLHTLRPPSVVLRSRTCLEHRDQSILPVSSVCCLTLDRKL